MFTYTADQLNALLQDDTRAKMAVEFSTYFFCSGNAPVTVDSDVYTPLGMEFGNLLHGEFGARTSLELQDNKYVLTYANYSTRFASMPMTWHFLLIGTDGEWVEIQTIDWYIRYCQWDQGLFKLNLFGNTGFKKRAGLSVMSRTCDLKFKGTLCGYAAGGAIESCDGSHANCTARGRTTSFRGFRFAPEPGEVLETAGIRTRFLPPPPPADGGFNPDPWGEDDSPPPVVIHRPTGRRRPT